MEIRPVGAALIHADRRTDTTNFYEALFATVRTNPIKQKMYVGGN